MWKELITRIKNACSTRQYVDMKSNSNITVNGKTYRGKNISIVNNKVIIDGVEQTSAPTERVLNVTIQGDADVVEANSVTIYGHVKGDVNANSFKCTGDVGGSVDANSVECEGDIKGDVDSQSIRCANIGGSVDSMSVKYVG